MLKCLEHCIDIVFLLLVMSRVTAEQVKFLDFFLKDITGNGKHMYKKILMSVYTFNLK